MKKRNDSVKSTQKNNQWLREFGRSVTSQGGEDGILEKILEVIDDANQWTDDYGDVFVHS